MVSPAADPNNPNRRQCKLVSPPKGSKSRPMIAEMLHMMRLIRVSNASDLQMVSGRGAPWPHIINEDCKCFSAAPAPLSWWAQPRDRVRREITNCNNHDAELIGRRRSLAEAFNFGRGEGKSVHPLCRRSWVRISAARGSRCSNTVLSLRWRSLGADVADNTDYGEQLRRPVEGLERLVRPNVCTNCSRSAGPRWRRLAMLF